MITLVKDKTFIIGKQEINLSIWEDGDGYRVIEKEILPRLGHTIKDNFLKNKDLAEIRFGELADAIRIQMEE